MSKKLFLIDGSAMYYRSYFAFSRNPLINSKGENTSATFGFLNSLVKLIDLEHPEYLAIVFDTKEPTFRHKIFEEYKATREKMPEEMAAQYPRLIETLKAANFNLLEKEGYEADDIIGTLARRFGKNDVQVFVVSGDKDMAQLVNDHVFLYNLPKKQEEPEILGKEEVLKKYGIRPDQIIDWLALMGDKSDNIPGIPKVGEKTAARLLEQFGSIENLYANLDQVSKEALRKKLSEFKDQTQLSRKLTTIDTNVPIDVSLENLKFQMWDMERLGPVLQQLEFRTLARRMEAMSKGVPGATEFEKHDRTRVQYRLISQPDELDEIVKKLKQQKRFVFDLETSSLDFLDAEIAGIALCWNPGEASYISVQHESGGLTKERVLEKLRSVFEDPSVLKIGQNIKYDAMIMEQHGIAVKGLHFDTMIASYLVNPTGAHNLDRLAEQYLNYQMIHIEQLIGKGKKQKKMTDLPAEFVFEYACEDADITFRLYEIFKDLLKQHNMDRLFYDLEMPLVHVLMRMEQQGVAVDEALLKKLSSYLQGKIEELETSIYKVAGERFNLNSPQQLGVILFDKLEIHKELGTRKPSRTKTGQYSTSEKTLERYQQHPVVASIMEYRKLVKLKNTYLDALPRLIHPRTGRIHTSYNQTVTATGRLSSSNPNLQNIPIRTELGKEIRRAFIPSRQDYLILSADYSQIELRIMAHLSEDPTMIENFKKNLDIHAATASLIFHIPVEEVTPDHRRKAKEINFGIIYGMSEYGLASRLGITTDEAKEFIADYFATYPKIGEFMQRMIAEARKKGYVQTMLGRRRYLPEIRNQNRQIREFAERTAINTPIQGSAADLIKKAMIEVQTYIERNNIPARMLLQVHDELVFEVKESEAEKFAEKVRTIMDNAMKLKVPLVVDWGLGPNWLEAH